MLAGMPLAASLGAEAFRVPIVTGFSMSLNGNAITVSGQLYQRLLDTGIPPQSLATADALKKLVEEDKARELEPLRFAMVYPSSSHNYLLRYWLASAGIDPDRDIRLSVVPPPLMADCLRKGLIDGYCVGEPLDIKIAAASVYRPSLYRQAADALGVHCPPFDRKLEGLHEQPWLLLATPTDSFTFPQGVTAPCSWHVTRSTRIRWC